MDEGLRQLFEADWAALLWITPADRCRDCILSIQIFLLGRAPWRISYNNSGAARSKTLRHFRRQRTGDGLEGIRMQQNVEEESAWILFLAFNAVLFRNPFEIR